MADVPTCKAVVCPAEGEPRAEIQSVPIPQLKEGLILVKVKAVALNPADWKSIDLGLATGTRNGCDYAGVVEAVGPGVTKAFKKGDRICGIVFGAYQEEPEMGAFGEYIAVKGDLQIKIPDNLSFEEASTLGIGITTVGQGLYQILQLPSPHTPLTTPIPILIYGGSTATGVLAIQFAKASGLTVLTTSSPRNFDYLKSLGADAVYDYRTDDLDALAAEIKARADNKLTLAFDCTPTEDSARLCAKALSDTAEKVKYCGILQIDAAVLTAVNPRVEVSMPLAYTVFGHAFKRYGLQFPDAPQDYEFGTQWWETSREMLAAGKVKVVRTDVNRGGAGLEGVVNGLQELKEGLRVSGTKLVYTI